MASLYKIKLSAKYTRTYEVVGDDYDEAIEDAYGMLKEDLELTTPTPDEMEFEEGEILEYNYEGEYDE